MSNYQSYQAYVPAGNEEFFAPREQIREDSPVYRTSSLSGVTQDSVEQSTDRGTSGHIAPVSGWQATARNSDGRATESPDITSDTLVTINGLQGKVGFFVSQGILDKTPNGSFIEGRGQIEATAEPQGDISTIPDSIMEGVNAALEPLPQSSLDGLIAHGISVATGGLDDASLTVQFAQASGLELADSQQRLTAVKAVYQAQADAAIASRAGIGAADAPEFWAWCRDNHKAQLHDAINKQLHGADVSGYTKLANQWMSTTAPSQAALKAGGLSTRDQGNGLQVLIKGSWMSPAAAARAGLV